MVRTLVLNNININLFAWFYMTRKIILELLYQNHYQNLSVKVVIVLILGTYFTKGVQSIGLKAIWSN